MEKNKYFQKLIVEDIGEIYLRYSQRIKNIKISINIIGDVLVVAPFFKNKSKVIKFLISNSNWIKINKKKSRNKDIKIISFDFNNNLLDDFKLQLLLLQLVPQISLFFYFLFVLSQESNNMEYYFSFFL